MDFTDTLATIETINRAASKVTDNQDALLCLSNRIRHIVETFEKSTRHTTISDDEYDASLTNISELIDRVWRLTRRMLKRALGDRTWNAGEIASELRRLNEDSQPFLTLHTVKSLDLFQTERMKHQQFVRSSVDEIIIQIEELDLVAPPTKPGQQTSVNSSNIITASRTAVPGPPDKNATSRSTPPPPGLASSEPSSSTNSSLTTEKAQRPPQVDLTGEAEGLLFDRLRAAERFPLTIAGLQKYRGQTNAFGDGSGSVTLDLPGNARVDEIEKAIGNAGFVIPQSIHEADSMNIVVTEGDSVYDAMVPGGLKINENEPLLWWMNKYEEYHGLVTSIPMQTDVSWTRESLETGGLTIKCHRTVRVGDQIGPSHLPPNMGNFPFFPVSQLGPKVPEEIRNRGGFIMPMFRREAMWMSFQASVHPAVKVSVGGVNAISGEPSSSSTPLKRQAQQDYIVAGRQPWLDGVVTGPGVVRQFVVTELHKGYTVEEQVIGECKVAGIQFDIYPQRKRPAGTFYGEKARARMSLSLRTNREQRGPLNQITATPKELGQSTGQVIEFRSHTNSTTVLKTSWTLSAYAGRMSGPITMRARYPDRPVKPGVGSQPHVMRPPGSSTGRGGARSVGSTHGILGISAGGQIAQKIHVDSNSVRNYDQQLSRRLHIHIVTPEFWEDLTGFLPPITPITREAYLKHNIPWFKLYDDYVQDISHTSQQLAGIASVTQLDVENMRIKFDSAERPRTLDTVINPNAPPPCLQHPSVTSSCVFRPCGHAVCANCLGVALLGGNKCGCGATISKFIGMDGPLPNLVPEAHEAKQVESHLNHWSVRSIEQLSTDARACGKLKLIHLRKDDVAPLRRRD